MEQLSLVGSEERLLDPGYKCSELLYFKHQKPAEEIIVHQPTRANYDELVACLEA
jgi:hypothetical protein